MPVLPCGHRVDDLRESCATCQERFDRLERPPSDGGACADGVETPCKGRPVLYSGASCGVPGGDGSRSEATLGPSPFAPQRCGAATPAREVFRPGGRADPLSPAASVLLAQSCRRSACPWTASPLGAAASTTAPLWRSGPWLEAGDASVESSLLADTSLKRVTAVYEWIKTKRAETGDVFYMPHRRVEPLMYSRLYKIQNEQGNFHMEVPHLRLFAFSPDMLGERAARWFGEVSRDHRLLRTQPLAWGQRYEAGRVGHVETTEQSMAPA